MSDSPFIVGHYMEMWLRKLRQVTHAVLKNSSQMKTKVKEASQNADVAKDVAEELAGLLTNAELKQIQKKDIPKLQECLVESFQNALSDEPHAKLLLAAKAVAQAMSKTLENIR